MNQRTVTTKIGIRLVLLAVFSVVLGGCATYYQSHYPDSGVYYGAAGGYGHSAPYSRSGYGPVNPVDYPYWSIDYFYFSQYYHPYSVYVGYNEPLYYPYPGWAFSRYRPMRSHASLAFGFGYPWYGHGYRYPAYSFGFFSGYDPFYYGGHYRSGHHPRNRHNQHRIRQIDRRLQSLQQRDSYASRRELLGNRRVSRSASDEYISRNGNRNAARGPSSRAALLQNRDSTRSAAPDRRLERRATGSRTERRSELRSNSRPSRRAIDRQQIERSQSGRRSARDDGRSAAAGQRGIPIESLRGRVIVDSRGVNSRDTRTEVPRNRQQSRRVRAAATRDIQRAPAIDWNSNERLSRQASGRSPGRADNAAEPLRGNLLRRPNQSSAPPSAAPARRASPPPSRPASDTGRSVPTSRDSSPARSRRDVMRSRSGEGGNSRRNRGNNRRR